MAFNLEIPRPCVDFCPLLVSEVNLAAAGIILTRNCSGPRLQDQEPRTLVQITAPGVAREVTVGHTVEIIYDSDRTDRLPFGDQLVCTNVGANLSLNEAIEKGRET